MAVCSLLTVSRILTVLIGGGLIALGVCRFIFNGYFDLSNPGEWIMNVYYIFFGVLLLMTIFSVQYFKSKYGFLTRMFGKGLFFIFLGTMCLISTNVFQIIAAIACGGAGVIHIMLSCASDSPGDDPKQAPMVP